MAKKVDLYFGEADLTQIIGDKLNFSFQVEVQGTNFSFTDYTVSGIIFDKEGNTVTTLTTAKSTGTVTDDTITVTANPTDLPTDQTVYGYYIKQTLTADSEDVKTILRGKMLFVQDTNF